MHSEMEVGSLLTRVPDGHTKDIRIITTLADVVVPIPVVEVNLLLKTLCSWGIKARVQKGAKQVEAREVFKVLVTTVVKLAIAQPNVPGNNGTIPERAITADSLVIC